MPINEQDVQWIEEPHVGFWEATYLPGIAKGLKTTINHPPGLIATSILTRS
jgi:NADH-quinone oxidoreductase subunit I